jgi:hypothetical protein
MQVLFHICRETIVIMRPEKIIIAGCWTSRFIGSKADRAPHSGLISVRISDLAAATIVVASAAPSARQMKYRRHKTGATLIRPTSYCGERPTYAPDFGI